MKTIISFWLLLTSISAFPSNVFSLGGESFQLCFLKSGYSEAFKSFVTEDVERIFAPLRSISNAVDVVSFQAHPEQCCRLIHHEGYPEHFFGSFSISNANGALVFLMDEAISEKYKLIFDDYSSIDTPFSSLTNLLNAITSGSITNQTNASLLSLIFIPVDMDQPATEEQARALFTDLHRERILTASVLDIWTEDIFGERSLMAASKTVNEGMMGLDFSPVFWIFRDGMWRFFHPALWRAVPTGTHP